MSYYITWWKEGMEMPARLGPMTFEDRGDAERVAAGLNKKISWYITPRRRGLSITLLTDLKKLREMQSKEPARADEHGNAVCCDVEYINALYSHAPAMLEVLRCSQGGDAVELDRIGRILERAFHDPTALWGYTREDRLDMLDCIKLHQKAASLMEGQ